MKIKIITIIGIITALFSSAVIAKVAGWNPHLEKDAIGALEKILKKVPKLNTFYEESFGYTVIPKVTKAGIALGGAIGKGVIFKNHKMVGYASLKQATLGIQFGGQQYSEIIFFENENSFQNFINGKLKFDAQASAVAIKASASANAAYSNGVAVFTQAKGGLMYEASIGGQHFSIEQLVE